MEYHFDAPSTPNLRVEITAGELEVHAEDTATVDVTLEPMGRDPERSAKLMEQIRVEQSGDTVSVIYPKDRGKLFGPRAEVRTIVRTPTGTVAVFRSDSADIRTTGTLGDVATKSGSGDVALESVAELDLRTGSGDVEVSVVAGSAEVKTGSGDIELDAIRGTAQVQSGSGDIRVGAVDGRASVRSASGDVVVGKPGDDLDVTTASGDSAVERVSRGTVQTRAASGDIRIGIVDGVAVLLDVSTVSGDVRSQLEGTDEPPNGEGVRVAAHTASGEINLVKVNA